ncbi:MAG TPA: hypothetical protein VIY08_08785 [Candidatus Nitrosocosmicus sp.]
MIVRRYPSWLMMLLNQIVGPIVATTIGKQFAEEGVYDSNDIFRYLSDNGYTLY